MEPISQNFLEEILPHSNFFTGNSSTRLGQNLFFATFYKILANLDQTFWSHFRQSWSLLLVDSCISASRWVWGWPASNTSSSMRPTGEEAKIVRPVNLISGAKLDIFGSNWVDALAWTKADARGKLQGLFFSASCWKIGVYRDACTRWVRSCSIVQSLRSIGGKHLVCHASLVSNLGQRGEKRKTTFVLSYAAQL